MKADLEAGLYRLFRFNPCVSRHELRLRMRGPRAFWVFFAYAGVAAAVFLITLWATAWESRSASGPGLSQPNLGRTVLIALTYTQLVLILLILPAYSAGAVTMEREKRTLDMLRATLLTPSDVVSGKLLVVLALGLVLLLTSLPIAAWSLLLGGVAPEEILYLYSYLLVVGIFAASLGMLFSALLGRSVSAVVATYGTMLALLILPPILLSVLLAASYHGSNPATLTLGDVWGAILLTATGLVGGWLLFLALRWAWRRLLGRRWPVVSLLLPALLVLFLLPVLLWPGGVAMNAATKAPIGWLFVLEPYISVYGLLEGGEIAREFLGLGTVGPHRANTTDYQVVIWVVCSTLTLLAALLCWVLSLRAYRARE